MSLLGLFFPFILGNAPYTSPDSFKQVCSTQFPQLIPQACVYGAFEASQEYFHNKRAHSHISKIQHSCNKAAEVAVCKASTNTKQAQP